MSSASRKAKQKSREMNRPNSSIFGKSFDRRNQMTPAASSMNSFNRRMNSFRGNSIYSKVFLSSKVTKPRYRNILQIQSSLEQREQYKKLIEQYKNVSVNESEQLFSFKTKKETVSEIIDLDSSTFVSLEVSPKLKQISEQANKTLESARERVKILEKMCQNVNSYKSNNTLLSETFIKGDSALNNETKNNWKSSLVNKNEQNEVLVSKENGKVNKSYSDINKSFILPPSRYLAENFIPQLMKTYGTKERERQRKIAEEEARIKQTREKRENKEKMLAEVLKEKLKLKEELELKEAEPDDQEEELPELSEEMEEFIDDALVPNPPHEVLVEEFNISITRSHMHTLDGLNWLNDEVINYYMELIVARSKENNDMPCVHAMNTFFYPKLKQNFYSSVRRWTRRVDIFSKDIILFPIHLGVHWCLSIADFRKKEIRYYDSMGGSNKECLGVLKDYLVSEHKDKKKSDFDIEPWKLISMDREIIPQQMNGSDCGVFTCKFAEYIAADCEPTFSQDDMPYFRRAMVWEILNKTLLR